MPLARVSVSANGRHLVTEDGAPFFWLADTVWELFHRLTRDEAARYFTTRRRQRFNVVQAVALAELDGLHTPNANGDRPLHDDDPIRPNEPYWRYVDELIDMAAAHDLYVALLPTWGDKVVPMWGAGPVVFNEQNAAEYGRWLAARYCDRTHIIWVLGGDRPAVTDSFDVRPVWRAMAAAIREAGPALITYHPMGGMSSAEQLHDQSWLDLNMIQSGHGAGRDVPVWETIARDYARTPAKPVLDGEPNYEDHPVSPWPTWDPANGFFRDHDVRKQSYRSVFAGGCGVTYGHQAVWQCYDARYEPLNHVDRTWQEALERPGAEQIGYLRALIEARPMLERIPDQALIAGDAGAGGAHMQATRDAEGRYALVYLPEPQSVAVRLGALAGEKVRAGWYNPRDGSATSIGGVPTSGVQTFTPPDGGPDWVLTLDAPL